MGRASPGEPDRVSEDGEPRPHGATWQEALRFSDAERRKLAVLGKKVGRRALGELATIATPDTILRWYRELVAKKYDGSGR